MFIVVVYSHYTDGVDRAYSFYGPFNDRQEASEASLKLYDTYDIKYYYTDIEELQDIPNNG